jgi:TusA-related sulfurtransferase
MILAIVGDTHRKAGLMEVNGIQGDATIDIRHSVSPISLLLVEYQLANMETGQVLQVLCDDMETKVDLMRIIKNSGHRFIDVSSAPDHFTLMIEKRERPV